MRILFFIETLRSGGKERRLVELIKGLSKYPDIKMELVLMETDVFYNDIFKVDIKIHYLVRKVIKKDPLIFFKFYKIAKKFNPDIINTWGNMVTIYSIPSKIILNVKLINNEITDSPKFQKKGIFYKIAFKKSDLIVANSIAGLKSYRITKNSKVIYNGFNFKRLENLIPSELMRKNFDVKTKYIVGMVASFTLAKDYHTYLEVAVNILKQRKDVTFLCIGAGDFTDYKLSIHDNLLSNIKFISQQKDIESLINIFDVSVLSTFNEGISNFIMESMALVKPVVVSEGGGTSEIVIDGETGFIVKQQSSLIMAEKIDLLLNNKDLREQMGERGINRIKTKFEINNMISKFIDMYKNLMI